MTTLIIIGQEYLGPRGMRLGSGGGSTVRNFIICIVHIIKSRRLRWTGYVDRMEEGRTVFKILSDKLTQKRPLGRPRRR